MSVTKALKIYNTFIEKMIAIKHITQEHIIQDIFSTLWSKILIKLTFECKIYIFIAKSP